MPPIVHTVLLDLDAAVPGQVTAAVEALRALADLPGVRSMTVGSNVSPEPLSDGFTHAAVAVFESAAARDDYLVAPRHQDAVSVLQRCLRRVLVIDIEGA